MIAGVVMAEVTEFQMDVTVTFTVKVKARDRNQALKQFRDLVLSRQVVINREIMYHPDVKWGQGESVQDIDYESLKEVP